MPDPRGAHAMVLLQGFAGPGGLQCSNALLW
jgi:hypothetical protein